jgi:hypothetical protein
VGPRAGLRHSNSSPSVVQPVPSSYTGCVRAGPLEKRLSRNLFISQVSRSRSLYLDEESTGHRREHKPLDRDVWFCVFFLILGNICSRHAS